MLATWLAALLAAWALSVCAITALAMWRARRLWREAARGADKARESGALVDLPVLLVRPCSGTEPALLDNLTSLTRARWSFRPLVRLTVADPLDPALDVAKRAAAQLRAAGIECELEVHLDAVPNRKVAQLAGALRRIQRRMATQAPALLINVDSDVDLSDVDLDALVAPLYSGEAAASWAPFVEGGERSERSAARAAGTRAGGQRADETTGDVASRALLGGSLHGFVVLAGLDERSLVGKCFAARTDAIASVGGFEALSQHLGEDVELSRRLAERGLTVRAVGTRPISRASGRSFGDVVARYGRWIAVVRAQRPWLLASYPLLFFATLPICLGALALAMSGALPAWQCASIAVPALLARLWLARTARRTAGVFAHEGPLALLRDVLLADVLLALSFGRALLSRRISWRGREMSVGRGGLLSATVSTPAALRARR